MLIGVDLCNTISNINLELLRYFHVDFATYPSPHVPQDFFDTSTGLMLFMKAEPFPGAREVLQNLRGAGHLIEYVSSRPKVSFFVTKRWLALHGFPPGRIFLTDRPEEKADYVLRGGLTMLFEDDPRVIKCLKNTGLHIYIKDWQYNRFLARHENFTRFKRWSDLIGPNGARLG